MESENIFFFDTENYELKIQIVGEGSFGKVYIINNHEDDQKYAAKLFNIDHEFNGNQQMMFLRESLILHKLNHPSILQLTLITEYLNNGSLKQNINKEKVGLSDPNWNATKKYIILLGTVDAMRYLHDHGIIHRDLKPENILVDSNYYPCICDFGLSRCFTRKMSMTKNVGTHLYMAPEILAGRKDYGPSVDVYSFAILAYEIVTGKEPYYEQDKDSFQFTFSNQIINGFRPTFTDDINDKMKNLLTKCWSSNPDERPSFEEIFDALSRDFSYFNETVDEDEIEIYIDTLKENQDEHNENNELVINNVHANQQKKSFNFSDLFNLQSVLLVFLTLFIAYFIAKNSSTSANKLFNDVNNTNINSSNISEINNSITIDSDLIKGFQAILGNTKEQNPIYAFHFFNKSSENGNFYASYLVGLLYENGKGAEKNFDQAIKFYNKSIEQGNIYEIHRLGLCYIEGYGVDVNYKEAIKYFHKGANLNISDSIFEL